MTISLKEQFGKRYHVEYEEGHSGKEKDHEMFQLIPGKYGFIQLYDGELLAGYSNVERVSNKLCKEIDGNLREGFKVLVKGDSELRFSFPVERFKEVAKILKATTKKQLSADHKEKLQRALLEHRRSRINIPIDSARVVQAL